MSTSFQRCTCNICGSSEKIIIGLPEIDDEVSSVIEVPNDTRVVRCAKCGFYFTDPMPYWNSEDLEKLYGRQYFSGYSEWWRALREKINPNRRLDQIELAYAGKISKFLEVGCGRGHAMKQAVLRGWDVYGQDVTAQNKEDIKKDSGIEIFVGFLEDAPYPDNFFDCVYLDSVIEHVPDPSATMKELHRILKPKGIVYCICPNEDSLNNHLWHLMNRIAANNMSSRLSPFKNPHHISGFSRRTIKRLAHNTRYESVKIMCDNSSRASDNRKYTIKNEYNNEKRFKAIIGRSLRELLASGCGLIGDMLGMGTNLEAILEAIK